MAKIVRESIDRFFDYGIYLETRTIHAGSHAVNEDTGESGIDAITSERLIKAIHVFNQTPEKPITVILNSPGGEWQHGIAMYDALRASPCHITIEVIGQASSMGSVILQAAERRLVHFNSEIVIHDGYDGFFGACKDFEARAEQSKYLRKRMYEIYAERSGRDISFWEKRCNHDYYLTAQEAIDLGLADGLMPQKVFNGTP